MMSDKSGLGPPQAHYKAAIVSPEDVADEGNGQVPLAGPRSAPSEAGASTSRKSSDVACVHTHISQKLSSRLGFVGCDSPPCGDNGPLDDAEAKEEPEDENESESKVKAEEVEEQQSPEEKPPRPEPETKKEEKQPETPPPPQPHPEEKLSPPSVSPSPSPSPSPPQEPKPQEPPGNPALQPTHHTEFSPQTSPRSNGSPSPAPSPSSHHQKGSRLELKHQTTTEKLEEMRRLKMQHEQDACRFSPRILDRSRQLAAKIRQPHRLSAGKISASRVWQEEMGRESLARLGATHHPVINESSKKMKRGFADLMSWDSQRKARDKMMLELWACPGSAVSSPRASVRSSKVVCSPESVEKESALMRKVLCRYKAKLQGNVPVRYRTRANVHGSVPGSPSASPLALSPDKKEAKVAPTGDAPEDNKKMAALGNRRELKRRVTKYLARRESAETRNGTHEKRAEAEGVGKGTKSRGVLPNCIYFFRNNKR